MNDLWSRYLRIRRILLEERSCFAYIQNMSIHGHVRIKHATQVLDMRCKEDVSIAGPDAGRGPDVGDVDLLPLTRAKLMRNSVWSSLISRLLIRSKDPVLLEI